MYAFAFSLSKAKSAMEIVPATENETAAYVAQMLEELSKLSRRLTDRSISQLLSVAAHLAWKHLDERAPKKT
jgi:hypothetical protein